MGETDVNLSADGLCVGAYWDCAVVTAHTADVAMAVTTVVSGILGMELWQLKLIRGGI